MYGAGVRIYGAEVRFYGAEVRIYGAGVRIHGAGVRIYGAGVRPLVMSAMRLRLCPCQGTPPAFAAVELFPCLRRLEA
jgi:hypothetical protein